MTTRMMDGRVFKDVSFSIKKSEIEEEREKYRSRGYYTRITKELGPRKSYTLWVAKKNLSESKIYQENRKHSLDKGIQRNLSRGQVYHRQRRR